MIFSYSRVSSCIENLERSGNLKKTPDSQGICHKIRNVRKSSCKIHFSQSKNPDFQNFLWARAPELLNNLGLTVQFDLSLGKSGKFNPSGKWKHCKDILVGFSRLKCFL